MRSRVGVVFFWGGDCCGSVLGCFDFFRAVFAVGKRLHTHIYTTKTSYTYKYKRIRIPTERSVKRHSQAEA